MKSTFVSNNAKKIELHYFFNDSSHTLNAIIRNKCEYEILAIIKEVASTLDIELEVESEASSEGGFKEVWLFIGKNKAQIAIIITLITLILSRIPVNNKELIKLQIENEKLKQIELRLKIEKLKKELIQLESEGEIQVDINEATEIFDENIKVKKHVSNFYYSVSQSNKINRISTAIYTDDNKKLGEFFVENNQFTKFILKSDELPIKIDEGAVIEIVSPVLKKGKYKWRGIYNRTGRTIEFSMKDEIFKKDVFESNVPFKNGTCIDVVLEINQKVDETGEIKEYGYTVITVLRIHDEKITFETPQGKKYQQQKEAEKMQLKLFVDAKKIKDS